MVHRAPEARVSCWIGNWQQKAKVGSQQKLKVAARLRTEQGKALLRLRAQSKYDSSRKSRRKDCKIERSVAATTPVANNVLFGAAGSAPVVIFARGPCPVALLCRLSLERFRACFCSSTCA